MPQKVLLLGATGHTGSSILDGLIEYGNFSIELFVRPSSADKPAVKELADRGLPIRLGDLDGPFENLVSLLSGFDLVISAIDASSQLAQINLATAAKEAGVKRFIPCGFTTVCPPGDVMKIRDDKEEVYQHLKQLSLPFTVIDVGYWYQISYPTLPSGRVDYASPIKPNVTIHNDGEAPNLLTDLRDIGRFVARIVTDDRTLNQYVYTYGDVLSENQIFSMMEERSGEKIERKTDIQIAVQMAKKAHAEDPKAMNHLFMLYISQYQYSKYVRCDNTQESAHSLGYLNARELYPDFKPITFGDFLTEVLDGKGVNPYAY
ncbi:Isoflavone reductase family protein [Penicillium odoratum]|uniref:Isoflavone reductase family protein n=1 Tax=Penicillium odoratum TaxID=1167516 RepID=UPI00254852C8|nr:Isoflavone reductase family protein [Penicillium odoratum]KAJ5765073.1 Isoflavone reductase family protein [Penicillium odoratum]